MMRGRRVSDVHPVLQNLQLLSLSASHAALLALNTVQAASFFSAAASQRPGFLVAAATAAAAFLVAMATAAAAFLVVAAAPLGGMGHCRGRVGSVPKCHPVGTFSCSF